MHRDRHDPRPPHRRTGLSRFRGGRPRRKGRDTSSRHDVARDIVQRGWRSGQATRATYSRSAPPDQSARSARRARPLKRTALLAKPVNGINAPQRPDCVAGHGRLELRNVVANYPFENSRGFPGSEPNSAQGDHSRLSCSAGISSSDLVKRTRHDGASLMEKAFSPSNPILKFNDLSDQSGSR
jgi:hypothetical protein